MNKDDFSEGLKTAVENGDVFIDKNTKTATVKTDWRNPNEMPDNPASPLLAKKKHQLGLTAELEKLGYTVKWENIS